MLPLLSRSLWLPAAGLGPGLGLGLRPLRLREPGIGLLLFVWTAIAVLGPCIDVWIEVVWGG